MAGAPFDRLEPRYLVCVKAATPLSHEPKSVGLNSYCVAFKAGVPSHTQLVLVRPTKSFMGLTLSIESVHSQ